MDRCDFNFILCYEVCIVGTGNYCVELLFLPSGSHVLYFNFNTLYNLVLLVGTVQRYFPALVPGQVGIYF